ncbi:MAG: S41 family peptidase [bacterium]|nr:S41 family peptidase [bacterium]MDZ4285484.1 S41 family peptidase [Candidatus Sungbacteria bacterium]
MKMLKCAIILLAVVFAFGCAARYGKVAEAPEKLQLTLEQFQEHWQIIVDMYVQPLPDTPEARLACFQKLIAKGLEECLNDRQSHYLTKEAVGKIFEELVGFYAGVGLELSHTDNPVTIVSVIEESPAEKSGKFQAGDAIIEVDGQDVTKESSQSLVGKIRGSADSGVTLRVKRSGKKHEPVALTRQMIFKRTVRALDIGQDITYIKIEHFNNPTPMELFHEISKRLLVQLRGNIWALNFDAKKFVIDLRGNPGGSVDAVGSMSYFFAESEDEVVLTTESRKGEKIDRAGKFMSPSDGIPPGIFRDLWLAVIIDGGSASASEIFAEFLNQSIGVPRVGTRSFGKGSVQQIISLEQGDGLYLTIAEYFVGKNRTPINKIGIQPEYEVEDTAPVKETSRNLAVDPANDPQLRKAIELLRQR